MKVIFTWNDEGKRFTEAEQEVLQSSAMSQLDRLLSTGETSGKLEDTLQYNDKPSRTVKGYWMIITDNNQEAIN